MPKNWLRPPTPSTRRRLNMTICALSVTVFCVGCSSVQIAEPQPAVPETLLTPELPLAKSWSDNFLKLLRSAEMDGSAAQPNTTRSVP